jgi:hypothetical protein
LGSIEGVSEVVDKGRLGIHQCFDLVCSTDLREDAGAIAAARGWALRELSWRTPSLEQIFARIALGDGEIASSSAFDAAMPAEPGAAARVELPPLVTLGQPAPAVTVKPAAPTKIVYNLNPFDAGAGRDLGKPKAVDTPKPPTNP